MDTPEMTLLTAGDIASATLNATYTAGVLERYPGDVVQTLGDHTYPDGTEEEFAEYFVPTWGKYKARIKPCAGNREYKTPNAAPYFAYFGEAAGDPDRGYYAYDLSPQWRMVVCNSEIDDYAGSPQEAWLREELASHGGQACIVASHRPFMASGVHGGDPDQEALFRACYDGNVRIILNGHDHHYERIGHCDRHGRPDPSGPRTFIVGSGGVALRAFGGPPLDVTEQRLITLGVLRLHLAPTTYRWEFIEATTGAVLDEGTESLTPPDQDRTDFKVGEKLRLTVREPWQRGNARASVAGSYLPVTYVGEVEEVQRERAKQLMQVRWRLPAALGYDTWTGSVSTLVRVAEGVWLETRRRPRNVAVTVERIKDEDEYTKLVEMAAATGE